MIMKQYFSILSIFFLSFLLFACGGEQKESTSEKNDSTQTGKTDTTIVATDSTVEVSNNDAKKETPQITIYYFHSTHRCATCEAIEECIADVLNNHFSTEVKNGQIKQLDINADEEKNEDLCEKYEAFGTSVFITQNYKGKESTKDMTADAFKNARSNPDEFERQLKFQIETYLK